MERRVLGRTRHRSSLITLGGAAFRPIDQREADTFIEFAIDHGVNHVDVAPTYGNNQAEVILGRWIKEYRKILFLACKTRKRMKNEASIELQRSLKRLQTDYFDLYQVHGLDTSNELDIILGEDGAIQAILEARDQGLVKHVGITSHNPINIMKAIKLFDFDTILLPVNYVLRAHPEPLNDYRPVLSLAKKRNLGIIAMKSIAKGPWLTKEKQFKTWYQPFHTQQEIDEAVWYTLSQYVTTATSSSDIQLAKKMITAANNYVPLSEEIQQRLLIKATPYIPLFPRTVE